MGDFSKYNRAEVLKNVEKVIADVEAYNATHCYKKRLQIRDVCHELSIFDWWRDTISLSQLKQMRSFLNTAGKLGYNGYVCFKVGAAGCSHGMWAHNVESPNGFSPDGECLFHSFRSTDDYWDVCLPDGEWGHRRLYKKMEDIKLNDIKCLIGK